MMMVFFQGEQNAECICSTSSVSVGGILDELFVNNSFQALHIVFSFTVSIKVSTIKKEGDVAGLGQETA